VDFFCDGERGLARAKTYVVSAGGGVFFFYPRNTFHGFSVKPNLNSNFELTKPIPAS